MHLAHKITLVLFTIGFFTSALLTASKPIELHIDGIQITITPESVCAKDCFSQEVFPISSHAKTLTIGPKEVIKTPIATPDPTLREPIFMENDGSYYVLRMRPKVSDDSTQETQINTTKIYIRPEKIKVHTVHYDGGSTTKEIEWCGCTTEWWIPLGRDALDPNTHACDTHKTRIFVWTLHPID